MMNTMVMAFLLMPMVINTKANFKTENATERAPIPSQMAISTSVDTKRIDSTGAENLPMQTGISILVSLIKTFLKGRAHSPSIVETSTKGNLKTVIRMALVSTLFVMAINTMENSIAGSGMGRE